MSKDNKFNETVYKNAYNKSHYTNCSLRLKPDVMKKINDYCTQNHISKNNFFASAALYVIDNNIDISSFQADSGDK